MAAKRGARRSGTQPKAARCCGGGAGSLRADRPALACDLPHHTFPAAFGPEIAVRSIGYSSATRIADKLYRQSGCARTGRLLWEFEYPTVYEDLVGYNNGPRSTPFLTSNRCYSVGAEGKLLCLDLKTGKLLWEYVLPYPANATPAVYEIDGREYLVIASGGGRDPRIPTGGVYVAFALPQ